MADRVIVHQPTPIVAAQLESEVIVVQTARVMVYEGPKKLSLRELPLPVIGAEEMLMLNFLL